LKADVSRAGEVGRKLFPPTEAGLITELIRRDLPYYDATLSREFIAGMTTFLRSQVCSTKNCRTSRSSPPSSRRCGKFKIVNLALGSIALD